MSVHPSRRVRSTAGTGIRRRRRPWYAKKRTIRLTLAVIVAAVALWLGSSVVCKILRPFQLVSVEKRDLARVESQYKALKAQNRALERQLHYLKTPEGIAREARKQGYVKPGERSLVIPEDSKPRR